VINGKGTFFCFFKCRGAGLGGWEGRSFGRRNSELGGVEVREEEGSRGPKGEEDERCARARRGKGRVREEVYSIGCSPETTFASVSVFC